MISSSLAGGKAQGSSERSDFKPEVAALMPKSAKAQDLMPWVAPYKYAVVDDKILLVDPVNSFMVVGILNR